MAEWRWLAQPLLVLPILLLLMLAGCSQRRPPDEPAEPVAPERAEQPQARPLPPQSLRLPPADSRSEYRPLPGAFPRPQALEPAVGFWRKVYSVWRRSQVAIHDDRHLDVVYEIFEVPGPVAESLTPEQKDAVASRRNYWTERLGQLEEKMNARLPLDADERLILARFQADGRRNRLAGASERVHSQRGTQERFFKGLEIGSRYDGIYRQIFREAGLPEDLAYLPHVESSFQASARSSAGAVGIWQFTRGAAERFMTVNARVDERLDPIASARGAARYLSYAYAKLRDWPAAITSYNHGINGMMRAQNQMGSNFVRIVQEYDHPNFGFASRNYYAEFLAASDIARSPERFLAARQNYGR